MNKIKKMAEELFTPNPLDHNVYDITLKEKVHQDGYFSLEFKEAKVFFRGLFELTLLDEQDKAFRKGLEQFIHDQEELDKLAIKYIHAYNKSCSVKITPFLHEKNYSVEGDGEPEWVVFYKKEVTELFSKFEKNKDMIMTISEEVDRAGFNIIFKEIKEYYFGTRSQMLKEAREKYVLEKQKILQKEGKGTVNQPVKQAESIPNKTKEHPSSFQIKIFSNTDKQVLEMEVNKWLVENSILELNGLEFNTCSLENKVESNIFIVYKK